MHRVLKVCLSSLLVLCIAQTGIAQEFTLTMDGPADVAGADGADVQFDVVGQLATAGLGDDDPGAQGWSVSVKASGDCELRAIAGGITAGAQNNDTGPVELSFGPDGGPVGGFAKTETTSRGAEGCENGAVSAVVLNFTAPITLRPGSSPHDLFVLTLGGIVSGDPDTCNQTCTYEYANGCQGSGQPVDNKITLDGQTVDPALEGGSTAMCVVREPCDAADLNVTVSEEPIAANTAIANQGEAGVSDVPDQAPLAVAREGLGGETVALDLYGNIASTLGERGQGGVQGWSLGAKVSGAMHPTGATTEGTAGANSLVDPAGVQNGGFEKTELIDPAANSDMEGFVTAVVLSFTMPITLDEDSVSTVVCVSLESDVLDAEEGAVAVGSLEWMDGLAGSGQPVRNVATVDGETNRYQCLQSADVSFTTIVPSEFIRGDSNGDGQTDIADAVFTLNALFRDGPPTTCDDAADANDDALIDVSDALFTVLFRFSGDAAPPAPYPECGEDPEGEDDGLGCTVEYAACQ